MYNSTSIPLPSLYTSSHYLRLREENKRTSSEQSETNLTRLLILCTKEKLFRTRLFHCKISIIYDFKEYILASCLPFLTKNKRDSNLRLLKILFFLNLRIFMREKLNSTNLFTQSKLNYPFFSIYLAWLSDTFLRYPRNYYWNNAGFLHYVRSCLQGPISTRTPVNCVCCISTKTGKNVLPGYGEMKFRHRTPAVPTSQLWDNSGWQCNTQRLFGLHYTFI